MFPESWSRDQLLQKAYYEHFHVYDELPLW